MNDGDFNSYDIRPEKDNQQQDYYKVILTLTIRNK